MRIDNYYRLLYNTVFGFIYRFSIEFLQVQFPVHLQYDWICEKTVLYAKIFRIFKYMHYCIILKLYVDVF